MSISRCIRRSSTRRKRKSYPSFVPSLYLFPCTLYSRDSGVELPNDALFLALGMQKATYETPVTEPVDTEARRTRRKYRRYRLSRTVLLVSVEPTATSRAIGPSENFDIVPPTPGQCLFVTWFTVLSLSFTIT